jgi:hypothetical protein
MELRPVGFRYKPEYDPDGKPQYGLIAEEVASVAPQLVEYEADGQPHSVHYEFVNAMLLNEVQRLDRENGAQAETIASLQQTVHDQQAQLGALSVREEEVQRLERENEAQRRDMALMVQRIGEVESALKRLNAR